MTGRTSQAGPLRPDVRTVQGELEGWITRVLRLNEPTQLVCAGRTDAGVHARGQVAHLDLDPTVISDGGDALTRRLNKVLGGDCVVRRISAAPPGFDARFAAIWRRYVYRLSDAGVAAGSALPLSDCPGTPRSRSCSAERGGSEPAWPEGFRRFLSPPGGGKHDPDPPRAGGSARTIRSDGRCHRVHRTRRCVLSLDGAIAHRGTGRRRYRPA